MVSRSGSTPASACNPSSSARSAKCGSGGEGFEDFLGAAYRLLRVSVDAADLGVEVEIDKGLRHAGFGEGVQVFADLVVRTRQGPFALVTHLDDPAADEPQRIDVAARFARRVPHRLDRRADRRQVGAAGT